VRTRARPPLSACDADGEATMKIVVLEDNPLVGDGLVHTLRHLGHEALLATRIDEAKAITASHRDVALAIADAGLQDGEYGVDFLEWLRSERPTVRRILISGADARGGDSPAVEVFVKKPFGAAELGSVLRAL
jgi:DNA-binding response OmpR family regulator